VVPAVMTLGESTGSGEDGLGNGWSKGIPPAMPSQLPGLGENSLQRIRSPAFAVGTRESIGQEKLLNNCVGILHPWSAGRVGSASRTFHQAPSFVTYFAQYSHTSLNPSIGSIRFLP
jgi:hypothetical protein